jgi:hypothetical protein
LSAGATTRVAPKGSDARPDPTRCRGDPCVRPYCYRPHRYNPSLQHVLNERASIGWTSYAHTGVPVPVYAQGWQADQFAGFYDNTDIAKRLAKVMRLPNLPLTKDCP